MKVAKDGDVRVPCDMLFQARVTWLTRGMARSVVDDDRSRFCRLARETGNSSEAK